MALNSQPSHTLSQCREEGAHSYWSVSCFWVVHNIFWSVQPGRTQVMKVRFLLPCCGQIANVKAKATWVAIKFFFQRKTQFSSDTQPTTHYIFCIKQIYGVYMGFVFFSNRIDWNVSGCSATRRVNSFRANKGKKKNINGCTCSKESLRKADRNTAR